MLDIIIPVLNEEEFLRAQKLYFRALAEKAHLIFVDGGSGDRTVETAQSYGDVLLGPRGRASQKNFGLRASQAEHLLFLHVDAMIDPETVKVIETCLAQSDVAAGCLTLDIDNRALVYRFFEWIVNKRARWGKVTDGDLGLFVRKDIFQKVGGFDIVPVMEDILIGPQLKKEGRVVVLSDRIHVSTRKWQEKGFLKLLWAYTKNYVRFWMGQIRTQEHKNTITQE